MLKQIINQEESSDAQNKESASSSKSDDKKSAKSSSSPKMSASKNILSSDVEIKGTLKFTNDLIIDGHIEGDITSEGDLTVGENADVKCDIKTRSVTVFGKVTGNITVTDRCELKQNAELHGDVAAGKLAIEEGATFMGSSTVGAAAKAAAQSQPKPQESSPQQHGQGQQHKPEGGGEGGDGH